MKWKSILSVSIFLLCVLASCNLGTESQPIASSTNTPTAENPTASPTSTLSPTPPAPLLYSAYAQYDDVEISGVICNLTQPFTLELTAPGMSYPLEFTPDSSTSGAWKYEWHAGEVVGWTASGTYTVSGLETGSPGLVMTGQQTANDPVSGTIISDIEQPITLTELTTNECQ